MNPYKMVIKIKSKIFSITHFQKRQIQKVPLCPVFASKYESFNSTFYPFKAQPDNTLDNNCGKSRQKYPLDNNWGETASGQYP